MGKKGKVTDTRHVGKPNQSTKDEPGHASSTTHKGSGSSSSGTGSLFSTFPRKGSRNRKDEPKDKNQNNRAC